MDGWKCPAQSLERKSLLEAMKAIIGCSELTHDIIDEYRKKSWRERKLLPWEHCGMHFEKMYSPFSRERMCGIYTCDYRGKTYYFGIGLDEPVITDDMEKNGRWLVYTWAD